MRVIDQEEQTVRKIGAVVEMDLDDVRALAAVLSLVVMPCPEGLEELYRQLNRLAPDWDEYFGAGVPDGKSLIRVLEQDI